MRIYLTPKDVDQLPEDLQMKIQHLTPSQMENVKARVRARMKKIRPKQSRQWRADADRKAQEIMRKNPPREIFDRFEYSMPYSPNVNPPPRRYRVSPRYEGELVDIPLDLQEGVKAELVETYGIDDNSAAVIAGNAIDRWVEMTKPRIPKMTNAQATFVEKDFAPKFLIHPLAPTNYPGGPFHGMGQAPDEAEMPKVIAPAPSPVSVPPKPVAVNRSPAVKTVTQAYKDAGWRKVVPLVVVGGLLIMAARRK